ncbi:DnaD domain-containing protein [Salimicrobium humidisoli]|uniref:DNA replication protein DnaD n=1 Tax=Salimicrobium humidisoli TaxID=2029857 RepID=A0ABX4HRI3_9BACI|nr:DnaD domain-containing protein [Salimicrobium humidisoli]PBB05439.1 DNA replication protein DnaD [Salimicrobium humidisoli]
MTKNQPYEYILQTQLTLPQQLVTGYKALGMNETELAIVLQLFRFKQEGVNFPTPEEIAEYLTVSEEECSNLLRSLIQKGIVEILHEKGPEGIIQETYSLEPLFVLLFQKQQARKESSSDMKESLFPLFEKEFGRPLSPFEIETINIWLDEENYKEDLIKAALREAVLMGKMNFKYIDRILSEWERKGIRTIKQAQNHGKQFRNGQKPNFTSSNSKRDTSLYYNWLEEE